VKNLLVLLTFLILIPRALIINAQQAPLYTHYMENTLVVNPAYAGNRDILTVTALHRSQWVGFKGAPVTETLTAHTPLKNEHLGVGLSIMNDKIGPLNNTSLFLYYSYILKLNNESKMAFGLSAGMNIYNADLSSVQLDAQNDPAFQNNINNHVTPNFGFGTYYSRKRFYAGFSIPDLLKNNYLSVNQADMNTVVGREQRNYFLIAGTMFDLADNLVFKPSTLIKLTKAAPIQVDLTASFVIVRKLLVGVMYRTGDSFGCLIGFDFNNNLSLGYSYDWSYGIKSYRYNQGSHELFLRYSVRIFKKKGYSEIKN
jgi:type IX secretion system PorP/SprF family membrane protein